MIDLKLIRDEPERVRTSQRSRGEDPSIVDRVLAADERRRAAELAFGTLRNEQKELGKQIGPLQGQLKKASDDERASIQSQLDGLMTTATDLSDRVKAAEDERAAADADAAALVALLSNVVETAAPIGGEDDFVVLEHVGRPRDFAAEGITVRDHVELGEMLGAIDIERGAKVSGSRFLLPHRRGCAAGTGVG